MATQNNQTDLSKKLDLLLMIEFAKAGADRSKVREILGALDNNLYSKLGILFKNNVPGNKKK